MAFTVTVTTTISRDGAAFSTSKQLSGEGADDRSVAIPGNASNLLVSLALDVSQLQMVLLSSTVPLTIETNSSGSPQETITLLADVPFLWVAGSGMAAPFAGDVTALYVTNDSDPDTAGTLTIRTLFDATP